MNNSDHEWIQQLAPLQPLLRHEVYEAGRPITVPGQQQPHIYVLKSGRVRLAQIGPDGQELTIDYLEPGELFGALDWNDGVPSRTCAFAVTRTELFEIPRQAFEAYVAERPHLMLEVTKVLGDRHVRLQTRLHDLVFLDVRGRIMETLRYLSKTYGEPVPAGQRLDLRLTHLDVARLVGSSRETVSAAIAQLRAEGLLDFDAKRPVIAAPARPV